MLRDWLAVVATLTLAAALVAAGCDTNVQLGVDPDSDVDAAADAGTGS